MLRIPVEKIRGNKKIYSFLEYEGELHIFVLRRRKDQITNPTPHLGSE